MLIATACSWVRPAPTMATPATMPQGTMPTMRGAAARAPARSESACSRCIIGKDKRAARGGPCVRGSLFLEVAVEHLDELVRREKSLAPLRVELRGRLGGYDFRHFLALLDLRSYAARDRREHVAVGLQVGLGAERAVSRNDLGVVARGLELAIYRGEHAGDRPAARGVDERIEAVEEGVAHVGHVALREMHHGVAVGVRIGRVRGPDVLAVQMEARVAGEGHDR